MQITIIKIIKKEQQLILTVSLTLYTIKLKEEIEHKNN